MSRLTCNAVAFGRVCGHRSDMSAGPARLCEHHRKEWNREGRIVVRSRSVDRVFLTIRERAKAPGDRR
jgi:hypothetical protein